MNENVIIFTPEDCQAFLETMRNPPAPNEKLTEAYKRYLEMKDPNFDLDEEI